MKFKHPGAMNFDLNLLYVHEVYGCKLRLKEETKMKQGCITYIMTSYSSYSAWCGSTEISCMATLSENLLSQHLK